MQTEKARIKVENMHADILMQCHAYAEYTDQAACNKAREDSMKEALRFLEGWK